MRKLPLVILISFVLGLALSANVGADPVQPGDPVMVTKAGGTLNGHFQAQSGSTFWLTFCVERNEKILTRTEYEVHSIGGAIKGGIAGGNPDEVSDQTAWLYIQFLSGNLGSLGFVDGDDDSLDALQAVIWYLEQEVMMLSSVVSGDALSLAEQLLIAANSQVGAGWTNGGRVAVLNPIDLQDTEDPHRQSILIKVSEPGTLALLGTGLLGLAGALGLRRHRR
jgi:hypothetical protein